MGDFLLSLFLPVSSVRPPSFLPLMDYPPLLHSKQNAADSHAYTIIGGHYEVVDNARILALFAYALLPSYLKRVPPL